MKYALAIFLAMFLVGTLNAEVYKDKEGIIWSVNNKGEKKDITKNVKELLDDAHTTALIREIHKEQKANNQRKIRTKK